MSTRIVNSRAPIRICDNGGWTDTWFAQHGAILNIAVSPCAEVQLAVEPGETRISIAAENLGERYVYERGHGWQRQPLLEAVVELMGVPPGLSVAIDIHSQAPPGASTGTSAAVSVALVGALARLNDRALSPYEAAGLAHRVETELLGRQSGIQDQLAAAFGGINFIAMDAYPHATLTPVPVDAALRWELERRLVLVYLGRAHDSSQIHEQVIAQLAGAGPDCPALNDLRAAAMRARDALSARDLDGFGRALSANTDAQARLHPGLVSVDARRVIDLARAHHARGWKVNGAGGPGGSLAILSGPRADEQRAMLRAIAAASPQFQWVPIRLSPDGLRVWEMPSLT